MIKKLEVKDFEEIFSIMEQSFPVDEYRDKQGQRRIFDEKEYSVYGYIENQKILGFIMVWDFTDILYIEHFAVRKESRNLGIGGKLLSFVKENYKSPAVLEVEPPQDDLTKRRVEFYKRNGFKYNDYYYVQPSMAKGKKEIPLKILSLPNELSEEEFIKARDILYSRVYKIKK